MGQKHNCGKNPPNTSLPCWSLTCSDFAPPSWSWIKSDEDIMLIKVVSFWNDLWQKQQLNVVSAATQCWFFSIRDAFNSVVISVCERKWENYWRSRPLLCKSLTAALTNSSKRLFISPTWGIQDLVARRRAGEAPRRWGWIREHRKSLIDTQIIQHYPRLDFS